MHQTIQKGVLRNPVIRGVNADPSICRVEDDFYLVTSSMEMFPGIPLYHSKNLVNWELIGHCLTRRSQVNLAGRKTAFEIFASTIRYHKGRFYVTSTDAGADGIGNFIVYTDDIRGEWSDPLPVDQGGIDPSLFFDDDGKVYYTSTTSFENVSAIQISEVNPDTGARLTEPMVLTKGYSECYTEGPHIFKLNGYYYLIAAEGGTGYGHMETAFRAKSPYGPYESCPHNPILSHRQTEDDKIRIQTTGHADLIQDQNGTWWLVCLGTRSIAHGTIHNLGRETMLTTCRWENGWPIIGDNGIIKEYIDFADALPAKPFVHNENFYDDFTGDTLRLDYTAFRYLAPERYALDAEHGTLSITGEGVKLSEENGTPALLGIRQKEAYGVCKAKMRICDGAKAGLSAYYNESYHYNLSVRKEGQTVTVSLEKAIHDIRITEKTIALDDSNVELEIHMAEDYYTFFVTCGAQRFALGKGAAAGLCKEGTMMNTYSAVWLSLYSEYGTGVFSELKINYDLYGGTDE